MAVVMRGVVRRLEGGRPHVEIPDMGLGFSFGPCELATSDPVAVGTRVFVAQIGDTPEDVAVIGRIDPPATSSAPSGPAGGDLAGEYPNPTIRTTWVAADSNLPVRLGQAALDVRYARLAASQTFTGRQIFKNDVAGGGSPSASLEVQNDSATGKPAIYFHNPVQVDGILQLDLAGEFRLRTAGDSAYVNLRAGALYDNDQRVYSGSNVPSFGSLSGAIADGQLPDRLSINGVAGVTDWNNVFENGWYHGNGAANAPTAGTWYLGIVSVHDPQAGNRYVTQRVWNFTDVGADSTTWERRSSGASVWSPWRRIRQYESELDVRYAQVGVAYTKAEGDARYPLTTDARLSDKRTPTDSSAASLKAAANLTGGGTVTVSAAYEVKWTERFIVISNGSGAHFATNGYFDIGPIATGTVITGVGRGDSTVGAAGVQLNAWNALYYILPVGQASGYLAANLRIVDYASAGVIPDNWLLLAVRNGDAGQVRLGNGVSMAANQSWTAAGGVAHSHDATTLPTSLVYRVMHGAVAGTARPAVVHVEWVGSVAPTNIGPNDTWVNTSL